VSVGARVAQEPQAPTRPASTAKDAFAGAPAVYDDGDLRRVEVFADGDVVAAVGEAELHGLGVAAGQLADEQRRRQCVLRPGDDDRRALPPVAEAVEQHDVEAGRRGAQAGEDQEPCAHCDRRTTAAR